MIGEASAPASSGNLGPGFDCLALALDVRCRVRAEAADRWILDEGGKQSTPSGGELIVRAAMLAVGRPMRLEIDNDIPRSRGLGSSSAVTAAVAAACLRACGEDADRERIFGLVTELEGHPDNAAAAVYGGLVAAFGHRFVRLELAEGLVPVVAIPDYKLSTHKARNALPGAVRMSLAARTIARSVFLVEALRTGDRAVFAGIGRDEFHEAPRDGLSPLTGELIGSAMSAGAFHACWSGAGPTALAFADEAAVDGVMKAFEEVLGEGGEVRRLDVAADGLR